MIAARNDGEITFYEELGVTPDASPQQIREAFRLSVRLLHPDQQTDPLLREIAEKQMRTLNRVYAVLSDPRSRRSYDETLEESFSPQVILKSASPSDFRRLVARMSWAAAIVVSTGLLIWLAYDVAPAAQSRGSDSSGAPVPTAASFPAPADKPATERNSDASEISRLRSDLQAALVERDAAIQELNKLRGTPQGSSSGASGPLDRPEPNAPLTITELPSTPRPPVASSTAPPGPERPTNRKLAGFWFYAKPPAGQANKNKALYIPEYIEATITEDNGMIHGRYRSRFVIADRAISPDVNFTFTGTANGTQCNCQWVGAGGRGELILKLTAENSLRIDWTASELGTLGLGSGTAVLTRRIE
jgi:curved DNA-binding protein CbpA